MIDLGPELWRFHRQTGGQQKRSPAEAPRQPFRANRLQLLALIYIHDNRI